ncbi:MAG: methyltransferase family protein [Neptuniibacter sp.]
MGLEDLIYVGWALCGFAFMLAITAALQFFKAKTHIEPWRPAQSLILSGLFRYSRNPIYLAFILFTLGLGISLNSLWVMLSTIPATWVLQRFVILKEERYLTAKFGKQYLEYCERVRRWL